MTFNQKLNYVIEYFGGNTEFCTEFGFSRQLIHTWRKKGSMPAKNRELIANSEPSFGDDYWNVIGTKKVIKSDELHLLMNDLGFDPNARITIIELSGGKWEVSQ